MFIRACRLVCRLFRRNTPIMSKTDVGAENMENLAEIEYRLLQ